jgi:peptidoglycan hydrolase CwlO-like protein
MDSNLLIALLAGACGIVLIAVLTLVVNFVISFFRSKATKKQQESDIARWLTVRDNHTRDIASLRAEMSSLKNKSNGESKDTTRIWDRLRQLEDEVKNLKDRRPTRRHRDEDEDEDEDDRYARPARRRSTGGYR